MNINDFRRTWEQIDLSPEADERIWHELQSAVIRIEQGNGRKICLWHTNRQLSRTAMAAIVIGTFLTVVAIAAAAVNLPAVISVQKSEPQTPLTTTETPSPTGAAVDEAEPPTPTSTPTPAPNLPVGAPDAPPLETAEAKAADEAAGPASPETADGAPDAAETDGTNASPLKAKSVKSGAEGDFRATDGGQQFSFADGETAVGWLHIDGYIYYFLEDGTAATGLHTINGEQYFFLSDGTAASFRQLIGGVWRTTLEYQGADGETAHGWLDGKGRRYLAEDGRLLTGWQEIDGERYYFAEDGKQLDGWQEIDGDWYYFDRWLGTGGGMATGWLRYLPETYYFDADGRMVTGDREIDGMWYNFREDGALDVTDPDPFLGLPGGEDADPFSGEPGMEPSTELSDPRFETAYYQRDISPALAALEEGSSELPPEPGNDVGPSLSADAGAEDMETPTGESP